MISEPELIGEFGPEHTPEAVGDFDRKPTSGRRRGHGLLWAAAGALTASAIWATAVFAYGDGIDRKADPHGYQLGGRSCSALQMKALTASVGKREGGPSLSPGRIEHPALDEIHCFMGASSPEGTAEDDKGWSTFAQVELTVQVYKETDPRPVFEAGRGPSGVAEADAERPVLVPGLGDRAYLLTRGRESRLSVVEGAAVITLDLFVSTNHAAQGGEESDGSSDYESDSYDADLISDMRDVMKALKTAA
ncbi:MULTISPECIES: hypothetical protein [unclassified Streptomyces]|uniref:hypothetical protein n=1 Tax=unclassified Streptomyces TaxID=2593676 RepID=UPI00081DDBB9|nr:MULTISPECIES: hypothetical protein [unclassified Streptomyces]MYR94241.1 hypothetical protein [Streptomyces sp. SID4937]SCD67487.1 hypothetical protein GA0115243_1037283 [Streptomyces sp. ScaeMP-e83]